MKHLFQRVKLICVNTLFSCGYWKFILFIFFSCGKDFHEKTVICNECINKINNLDNERFNVISKCKNDGNTSFHNAVLSGRVDVLQNLVNKTLNNLQQQDKQYFHLGSIVDWINIENDNGWTVLDIYMAKHGRQGAFKLESLGFMQGSRISFKNKLDSKKFYYRPLLEELRWCFYNDNYDRAEMLVNYFSRYSDEMLSLCVQGYIRKRIMDFENDFIIPIDTYGKIVQYIGYWHSINDGRGNNILDEVVYAGLKNKKIYKLLSGKKLIHSDRYIEFELQTDYFKKIVYKNYLSDLEYFFEYAKHTDGPTPLGSMSEFIQEAMKKGDTETLRLFLSHSKVRIDNPEGENLIHFAYSVLNDLSCCNILLGYGAICEALLNNKKCLKNCF